MFFRLWRRWTRSEFWLLRTAWLIGLAVLLWTVTRQGV